MKRRKRSSSNSEQITITDIKLKIGDRLYKNGMIYGEISDESDTLFFILRPSSSTVMPSPYNKSTIIENILLGVFTLEKVNYE